ncbi:MAG: hypothetical protein U0169_03570 [Polyangiaceae bacterium]
MNAHRIAIALGTLVLSACTQGSLVDESQSGITSADKGVIVATGSVSLTAKNYGCTPISYRTAGLLLNDLGLKLAIDPLSNPILPAATGNNNGNNMGNNNNNGTPTASQAAYTAARASFGVADFPNRSAESTTIGTAQLAKMGDLFIEAAPEIIANFALSPRCGGISLFDPTGHPSREGLTCIGGQVASADAVQLAGQLMDRAVAQGMTQQGAQELVVAGYLSAQFTCR